MQPACEVRLKRDPLYQRLNAFGGVLLRQQGFQALHGQLPDVPGQRHVLCGRFHFQPQRLELSRAVGHDLEEYRISGQGELGSLSLLALERLDLLFVAFLRSAAGGLGCLSSLHLRGELGYERIQLVTILLRLG